MVQLQRKRRLHAFHRKLFYAVNVTIFSIWQSPSTASSSTFHARIDWYQVVRGGRQFTVVAQGPRTRQFTNPSPQFGGGGLFFVPFTQSDKYNPQVRPAMLFGVGMNYRLSDHLWHKGRISWVVLQRSRFCGGSISSPRSQAFLP